MRKSPDEAIAEAVVQNLKSHNFSYPVSVRRKRRLRMLLKLLVIGIVAYFAIGHFVLGKSYKLPNTLAGKLSKTETVEEAPQDNADDAPADDAPEDSE